MKFASYLRHSLTNVNEIRCGMYARNAAEEPWFS
jgi:hypothetical protein